MTVSGLPTVDDCEQLQREILAKLRDVEEREKRASWELQKLKKEIADWQADGEAWTYQDKRFGHLLKAHSVLLHQVVAERQTVESQRLAVNGMMAAAKEREQADFLRRAEEVARRLEEPVRGRLAGVSAEAAN